MDFQRNDIRNDLHKLKKMNSNLFMPTMSTFNHFVLLIFNVRYSCCFEYGVADLVSRVFSRNVPCAICYTFPPSLGDIFLRIKFIPHPTTGFIVSFEILCKMRNLSFKQNFDKNPRAPGMIYIMRKSGYQAKNVMFF